jgi:tetratricopeptide (TPR) repeat protein
MEVFLELAAKAYELNPRDASIALELALTNAGLRRWGESDRYIELAISTDPDRGPFWGFKAWFQVLRDGDLEAARSHLARITRKHRPTWSLWNHVVECFDRDYPGALKALDGMPEGINEQQFMVFSKHELAGVVYHLQGHEEEARAEFENARILFEKRLGELPDDARLHGRLGLVLAFLGDKEGAVREGAKCEQLYPLEMDHLTGTYRIRDNAYILANVGELDSAVEKLELLLSIPFGLTSAWIRLDPLYDPIRKHPRYPALLEMGSDPL